MRSVTSENILEMREEIQKTLEIRNNLSWKNSKDVNTAVKASGFKHSKTQTSA